MESSQGTLQKLTRVGTPSVVRIADVPGPGNGDGSLDEAAPHPLFHREFDAVLKAARKGDVLATKAVETRGKGSVLATKTAGKQGKGSVLRTET